MSADLGLLRACNSALGAALHVALLSRERRAQLAHALWLLGDRHRALERRIAELRALLQSARARILELEAPGDPPRYEAVATLAVL